MKAMCPSGYQHNGFIATHAFGHMTYGCILLPMNQRMPNKLSKEGNHENNVLSWLSPQWLYGNSCSWVHDVRLHIAGANEPKSAQQAK